MHTKILFPALLLLLSAVAFSFCSKDAEQVLPVEKNTPVSNREACAVTVKTNCLTRICGTQTNTTTCTACTGGTWQGVVLLNGEATYNVTPPAKMLFSNPGTSTCTTKVSSGGIVLEFTLAPNQVKEIKVWENCSLTGPVTCL